MLESCPEKADGSTDPSFLEGEVGQSILYFAWDNLVISFFLADFCKLTKLFHRGIIDQGLTSSHSLKVFHFSNIKDCCGHYWQRESLKHQGEKIDVLLFDRISVYPVFA